MESSIFSIDSNITESITRKVVHVYIAGIGSAQEWRFEELQHQLNIVTKTFHPDPIKADYNGEKKKKRQIANMKFRQI